jgi:hypothetical protein
MKKFVFLIIGATLAVFIASPCLAQSAKFAATVEMTELYDWGTASSEICAETIDTTMKVANKKDLLIGVSLQTGLYTDTTVKGKAGVEDTSEAIATIKARVNLYRNGATTPLSGNPQPGWVVFDSRKQSLRAILGGYLECNDVGTFTDDDCTETCYNNCEPNNVEMDCASGGVSCPDGNLTFFCECGGDLQDEEIQLVLETMGAHHFNYVAKDLEVGNYRVVVEICRLTEVDNENDLADAKLMVGPSSLTVEQVRATNTDDGIIFE